MSDLMKHLGTFLFAGSFAVLLSMGMEYIERRYTPAPPSRSFAFIDVPGPSPHMPPPRGRYPRTPTVPPGDRADPGAEPGPDVPPAPDDLIAKAHRYDDQPPAP